MYSYFNCNNSLAEQQFADRKLHSTDYAEANLTDPDAQQMESGHSHRTLLLTL